MEQGGNEACVISTLPFWQSLTTAHPPGGREGPHRMLWSCGECLEHVGINSKLSKLTSDNGTCSHILLISGPSTESNSWWGVLFATTPQFASHIVARGTTFWGRLLEPREGQERVWISREMPGKPLGRNVLGLRCHNHDERRMCLCYPASPGSSESRIVALCSSERSSHWGIEQDDESCALPWPVGYQVG